MGIRDKGYKEEQNVLEERNFCSHNLSLAVKGTYQTLCHTVLGAPRYLPNILLTYDNRSLGKEQLHLFLISSFISGLEDFFKNINR